ncbi:stage II sporulation protein R [Fictibacillus terranigra]|uniref:Stage II sporulation protein R n=1 Tax=Fictibacillus terranigra TaxID=3058424 RepID=A0ABT8E0Y9_9BACL|nr:stage II sporulation protein R [Fictibacillus sp. CENA-BCM004]MDN4071571.1 stage II sporulation protein R [Fictibacillus sp. CENA-BCM004]
MNRSKKSLMTILFLSLIAMLLFFETQTKVANATMNASVKIPSDAIRLRILANSDADKDQTLKRRIRDKVNQQITTWVGGLDSHDQAEKVIRKHLPEVENVVKSYLKDAGLDIPYKVQFNNDVAFPTKMYGNYIYPAGKYEAVLITLGKGEGANWWCVLFPPLCFLDFENGDAVKADQKNVKEVASASEQEAPAMQKPDEETVHVKFFLADLFTTIADKIGGLFS